MIQIERDFIAFKDLPFPPSVNAAYGSAVTRGKNGFVQRRFSTQKLTDYQSVMSDWTMTQKLTGRLAEARYFLHLWMSRCIYFEVQRFFFFDAKNILTLKGEPKANDVTNRIKALDDELAKTLQIDDKYFFAGSESKLIAEPGKKESVLVVIRPFEFSAMAQMTENMILMDKISGV